MNLNILNKNFLIKLLVRSKIESKIRNNPNIPIILIKSTEIGVERIVSNPFM